MTSLSTLHLIAIYESVTGEIDELQESNSATKRTYGGFVMLQICQCVLFEEGVVVGEGEGTIPVGFS